MHKPKALYYNTYNYEEPCLKLMEENFDLIRLDTPDDDTPEILKDIEALFAPLGYDCGKNKIDACPKLKIIASSTTGAPHIDIAYASQKNISVAYLATETEFLETITPTAEHTLGLMLSLIRRTPWAFDDVKSGNWNRFKWPAPEMLSRMSLGIIGLGRLGKMVAGYGKQFGMKVSYYDHYVDCSSIPDVIRVEKLEDIVSQCDIISVHAKLTEETADMINKGMFDQFKNGSYLINTSRGAIVNRDALLEALESGKIAGAALDVIEDEYDKDYNKSVANHPLVEYAKKNDNLLITPHIAGSTKSAWYLTRMHIIGMVIKYFKNRQK